MSKFDFQLFYGEGGDFFAASRERYSVEDAKLLATREMMRPMVRLDTDGRPWYVRHRAGVDVDGEPRVCWWLEGPEKVPRSCPVYVFEAGR